MVLTNLDQSGFRKLNLFKPTCGPAADGTAANNRNRNPDLVMLLEQYYEKIVDKSVELNKIDVCQLLAQPSFGMSIYKYISKQEQKCSDSKKSAAKSAKYRTCGNENYLRGRFSSAAYYYTMAIIYAPDVPEKVGDVNVDEKKIPEELSLAYGNRSAVFYELGQYTYSAYEAALTDIDHSLATGYPREKQPKLLLRKVECLISLKHLRDAKYVWEHLSFSDSELKDYEDQVLKIRFQLLGVDSNDECDSQKQPQSTTDSFLPVLNYLNRTGRYQPSPDFASMSTKVEPKYLQAKFKGRHLVAKQDIEPGDILMVESPFASVLNKRFEYHFCHHCCRKLESKIQFIHCIAGSVVPCTECTRVLYCSTDCRTESWRTYHQYECSVLPILQEMGQCSHLSLRMLLTAGLEVIQLVRDRNSQDDDENESKDPLSSLKISDPSDSVAQYGLVHQLTDLQDEHLSECVILSAVLLQLTKKCSFVRTSEQIQLASSILLRQLLQLYANSFNITGFEFSSEPDKSNDFAVGIYPAVSSLLNHSCEPNSDFTYVQSTVLILHATKKIPVGSQVTTSYHKNGFIEIEWSERRRELRESLYFQCECSRCVLEARDGLNGKYFPIGCKVCGSTLTRTSSSSDTFNCSSSSCSGSMSLSEAQQLYARIESRLSITDNRILSYGKSPKPELNFVLLKCELDLDELSNMPGLRNFWQLCDLHRRLGLAFGRFRIPDVRRHLARSYEINEAINGTINAVRTYESLIDLYREFHVSGDDEGDVIKEYRRIGQRLIELVRLTLIADVEPPTDGPDLLEEESRDLRKLYRDVVGILNGLPKEE